MLLLLLALVVVVVCVTVLRPATVLPPIAVCRHFAVVLLDEASQMMEPASLLTIARFSALRVLAVGDPQQLPPAVCAGVASIMPVVVCARACVCHC